MILYVERDFSFMQTIALALHRLRMNKLHFHYPFYDAPLQPHNEMRCIECYSNTFTNLCETLKHFKRGNGKVIYAYVMSSKFHLMEVNRITSKIFHIYKQ
jgi:hypothetical protein